MISPHGAAAPAQRRLRGGRRGAEDWRAYAMYGTGPLGVVLADATIRAALRGVSAWPEWDTDAADPPPVSSVVDCLESAIDACGAAGLLGVEVYAPATGTLSTSLRRSTEALCAELVRRQIAVAGVDVHLYPSSDDPDPVIEALEAVAAVWWIAPRISSRTVCSSPGTSSRPPP